jgi:hypothetical protein
MSKLLDKLSEFLARRKGLLPIIGILFIMANLMVQFIMPGTLFASSNLLLHFGLVIAIFGLMLAWAL